MNTFEDTFTLQEPPLHLAPGCFLYQMFHVANRIGLSALVKECLGTPLPSREFVLGDLRDGERPMRKLTFFSRAFTQQNLTVDTDKFKIERSAEGLGLIYFPPRLSSYSRAFQPCSSVINPLGCTTGSIPVPGTLPV